SVEQENVVEGISSIVNMDEDSSSNDVACDNNDNQIEIRKGLESNVDTTENEEAVVVGSEGGSSEFNSHSSQIVVEVSTSTEIRSKEGAEAEKMEMVSVPIAKENRDKEKRLSMSQEKETNQESIEINTNIEENNGNNNESEEIANS
ncbi:4144_t:CDS:2, partial [Scutellospora calospora]